MTTAITKNVALGVGGGIAAYKAAELARALMERGFSVQVLMTRSAEEFIRPLTFAALTGRKVITSLFSAASAEDTLSSAIEHIRVAQENQVLVIAPATADLLAKLAHGLADDLLTTALLATRSPVLLAPAMNVAMWEHAAVQAFEQQLDGLDACTGVPFRERVRAKQHRRPNDVVRVGLTDPARVAAEQAELQLFGLLRRDRLRDEPAEPGVDAVRMVPDL